MRNPVTDWRDVCRFCELRSSTTSADWDTRDWAGFDQFADACSLLSVPVCTDCTVTVERLTRLKDRLSRFSFERVDMADRPGLAERYGGRVCRSRQDACFHSSITSWLTTR